MKNIILMTALALVLAACGKSNTTSSGTSVVTNPVSTPTSNTSVLPTSDYEAFKKKVINAEFAYQGNTSSEYYFGKYAIKYKWGGALSYGSKEGTVTRKYSSSQTTPIFAHEKASNLAGLVSYLKGIVESPTRVYSCMSAGVVIPNCAYIEKGTSVYVIDLKYPIIANPVQYREKTSDDVGVEIKFETVRSLL